MPLLTQKSLETTIQSLLKEQTGPFYYYNKEEIKRNCRLFTDIPYKHKSIHFATMANVHPVFLKIIKNEGINVFVNSPEHLKEAINAGFSGEEIVYTASAMNPEIMTAAKKSGALVNLDSPGQAALWEKLFPKTPYGIRCNIGGKVIPRKTRGGYFIGKESRLGLTTEEIMGLPHKEQIRGLHLYVGTDILEVEYFLECYRELIKLAAHFPCLEFLDFGGGFGLDDRDLSREFDMETYGNKVSGLMEDLSSARRRPIKMILEPGRIIGGKAGYFICQVVDVKVRNGKQYAGVNASSVQFPRPLFYPDSAYHPVRVLNKKNGTPYTTDVYGCSTYSRDFLAREVDLPALEEGDTLVFYHAGSYCASSHTRFLGFPGAEEIFQ